MKEYQELLKIRYKSLELISPLEMLDCFSMQYVNLTIEEERGNDPTVMFQHSKKCNSIPLVEALNMEDYHKKVILILGGPGMGKSAFAINICKQWAEGDLLQSYKAVVLLVLRDPEIQGAKTIKDFLQILDDDLRENVYKEIIKSNGGKVCFIFEGYDELPYHLQKASVFAKFIDKLPKCTLVYTTRPEAYYQTPYKGSKIVRINGFNEASVDKYISKAFEEYENGEEMAQKLKTQVHNNPVVESILHIPINVAIVCLIFFQYSTLPKTLTELYILLCLRLILRHIISRTPNEGQIEKLQSLNDLPTDISKQFTQLCYIAYVGMENKKIMLSSQDINEFGVTEDKLHDMGFLLKAPTTSVYGRQKSYNFLHLTLQEFCAAWYISKLSAEEQVQSVKVFHNQEQFKMVWRFYSGITKLWNKELLKYMLPCEVLKSCFSYHKALELINIAYEASSSELCQIVGDYYKDSVVCLDSIMFESHAINYVLTQYKGLLRVYSCNYVVLIDWSQQHDVDVNHLLEDMAGQYLNSVYELFLSGENIKLISQLLSNSKTLKILDHSGSYTLNEFKCLANCKSILLQNLTLSQCHLYPATLNVIGEMLSNNKSIKFIKLDHNDITDEGIETLVYHLMDNTTLQQINLRDNLITADGVTHLSKLIIRKNSAVTSIDLSDNPLGDKGVNLLLQSLPLGMEHIGLCGVQMTSLSCQSLGNALHKVKSISFVELTDFQIIIAPSSQENNVPAEHLEVINTHMISISVNYWEVITTNLVNTTVLEHLEITLPDVPSSKLINAIGQNKSIKSLKLLMDSEDISCIESSLAADLAQYIEHSTLLEQLTVSGVVNCASQFFQLVTDSVAINTSIKSMYFELIAMLHNEPSQSSVYKFIDKLKKNNTLEELTFYQVYVNDIDNEVLLSIENCVQQINKTRNIKGIANLNVIIKNVAKLLASYSY